jgi:acetaldehyde dehydrogenase / alcohol dehydrogenase
MAVEEKVVQEKQMVTTAIDMANKAEKALGEFRCYTQEMVDKIVKEVALAALENHKKLAKLAVTETRRGFMRTRFLKICLRQSLSTITFGI